ncbi:hypothetical protein SCALM49S_08004 [Streptomyces californicus]
MQAFKNGDVAMMVNGPWAVADTLTGKEFTDKDNLGVAPVPAGSSAQGAPQGTTSPSTRAPRTWRPPTPSSST